MLYVVEVPKKGLPKCWSAPDMESFVAQVQLERKTICHVTDRVMFERITAKELLGRLGNPAPSELIGTEQEWLYDVLMDQGMHAKLYRADAYTKDDGSYSIEPINEYEATLSWLSEGLDTILVFESIEEARAALYDMRNWLFSGGMEGLTGLADLLEATPSSGTALGKAVLQQFQLCAART
jgi:hypothetical protein